MALTCALIAGALVHPALAQSEIPEVRFFVQGYTVEGDNPLDEKSTQKILSAYAGEHFGLTALKAAADELESEIRDAGFSFRRVIVPPQRLGDGIVTLRIVDFKLAAVSVSGNRHFSEENILASLPGLAVGEVPSARRMSRAVRFANEHPAKNIVLTFRESETENAVDARLKVRDEKPWNVFGLANNAGTKETGEERLSIGAQHNNVFNRDHEATFSYTTSPDQTQNVQQGAIIYAWPIYRVSGDVGAYAVQSEVDSGVIANAFEVAGKGTFFGLSYTQHLGVVGRYSQKASAGIENKAFENDVSFQGSQLGTDVRSVPLSLSYLGNFRSVNYDTGFSLTYASNLSTGSSNDDATYSATRAGARSDWDALRYKANFGYFFTGGWSARFALAGQAADRPLIPGEQFGIGGATSVRGFDERAVSGDSGTRVSLEAGTPAFFGVHGKLFYDAGRVELENAQPGEVASEQISSFGIGAAWRWRRFVSLNVDAAEVIDGTTSVKDGETKAHVSLYARF